MDAFVSDAAPGRMGRLLAILSVACFWLLPLSPILAIGAVAMTEGTSNRWRNLAVTGAVLCIVYTVAMALLIVGLYLSIRL